MANFFAPKKLERLDDDVPITAPMQALLEELKEISGQELPMDVSPYFEGKGDIFKVVQHLPYKIGCSCDNVWDLCLCS